MTTETMSLKGNISPRTEKWIRISAVLAMIIVAVSSAVLSFDGLKKVALDSQVPTNLAFLFPIAVDTTILMGSLAVLLYELFGVRAVFGWVTVLFGTLLSIVGNVISVKDAGIIAQVLHGIIPVLLCVSLESLLRILRFNIKQTRLSHASIPSLKSATEDSGRVQETVAIVAKTQEAPAVSPVVLPAHKATSPESKSSPVAKTPAAVQAPVKTEEKQPVIEKPSEQPPKAPVEKPEPMTPVVVSKPAEVAPIPVEEPAVSDAPDAVTSAPAKEAVAETPELAQSPASGNAELYRVILEAQPEDAPKARKVAEVLRLYPNASGADIKSALGDPPELRIDGTMRRAKEWLKKS